MNSIFYKCTRAFSIIAYPDLIHFPPQYIHPNLQKNSLEFSKEFTSMQVVGLEPTRGCPRKILSLVRLPFRHTCLPKKHFHFFLLSCCLNKIYITICYYKIQAFFEIFSIFLTVATVHPNKHLCTQQRTAADISLISISDQSQSNQMLQSNLPVFRLFESASAYRLPAVKSLPISIYHYNYIPSQIHVLLCHG